MLTRPPAIAAAIERFHALGIVPVVSTNGGIPHADIQIAKIPADEAKAGDVTFIDAWVTERGEARLRA